MNLTAEAVILAIGMCIAADIVEIKVAINVTDKPIITTLKGDGCKENIEELKK